LLVTKSPVDVFLIHTAGNPYMKMPTGEIANSLRLKIVNRTDKPQTYTLALCGATSNGNLQPRIVIAEDPIIVGPGETRDLPCVFAADPSLVPGGAMMINLRVTDENKFTKTVAYRFLGPGRSFGD
jgi:hypothetical protein